MKPILLLIGLTAGLFWQGTAHAQRRLELAIVEFGGVLPDVVTSGQTSIPGVELGSVTNTNRVGSGPLKNGKVLFTQSVVIQPGVEEQNIRMSNQRVQWSARFGGMQSGAVPIEISVSFEEGTDATFRNFYKRTFSAQANAPLGQTIVAQSRQAVSEQKKFTKHEGYSKSSKSQAFLLLIQVH